MPCGLPAHKFFQTICSLKCPAGCHALRAANPKVLSGHLMLEMRCGLPFRRYFQAIWFVKCFAGCQPAGAFKPFGVPTRRSFQAIWCVKCAAGCHSAGNSKPFGPRNALRAANPQVLSSHLVLEMSCGLPTRWYFQAIWSLKCPAGCQPAGTFKSFGA